MEGAKIRRRVRMKGGAQKEMKEVEEEEKEIEEEAQVEEEVEKDLKS